MDEPRRAPSLRIAGKANRNSLILGAVLVATLAAGFWLADVVTATPVQAMVPCESDICVERRCRDAPGEEYGCNMHSAPMPPFLWKRLKWCENYSCTQS